MQHFSVFCNKLVPWRSGDLVESSTTADTSIIQFIGPTLFFVTALFFSVPHTRSSVSPNNNKLTHSGDAQFVNSVLSW